MFLYCIVILICPLEQQWIKVTHFRSMFILQHPFSLDGGQLNLFEPWFLIFKTRIIIPTEGVTERIKGSDIFKRNVPSKLVKLCTLNIHSFFYVSHTLSKWDLFLFLCLGKKNHLPNAYHSHLLFTWFGFSTLHHLATLSVNAF